MRTVRAKSRIATAAPCILAAAALAAGSARAAATYTLDPAHSRIGFAIAHLGISRVKGEFTNFTGQVMLKKGGTDLLGADVAIRTESVYTGNAMRDRHILGEDFFDATAFPDIQFKGEKAERRGDAWFLAGTFTMHGVSKPMELPITITGPIDDPWGRRRIGLSTTIVLDRHQYGVGSDKLTDKTVGKDVTVEIDMEAVLKQEE
jgi:polyisoprenoid-binding protein YceI